MYISAGDEHDDSVERTRTSVALFETWYHCSNISSKPSVILIPPILSITNNLGRIVVNFVQWSMIAYPVFHPDSMLSATVVMVLGCVSLVLGLIESLVDMLDRERPPQRDREARGEEEQKGTSCEQVTESQDVGANSLATDHWIGK